MILPGFPTPLLGRKAKVPYLPIPSMTSNTTPSGWVASASSSASGTFPPWRAFDSDHLSTLWQSESTTYANTWLQLAAPSQFNAISYAITSGSGAYAARAPTSFRFEGSNDGTSFDVLDTRTSLSAWSDNERRLFSVASPGVYSIHRVAITQAGSGYIGIADLEFIQEDDL